MYVEPAKLEENKGALHLSEMTRRPVCRKYDLTIGTGTKDDKDRNNNELRDIFMKGFTNNTVKLHRYFIGAINSL